jgi:hypothetical protein
MRSATSPTSSTSPWRGPCFAASTAGAISNPALLIPQAVDQILKRLIAEAGPDPTAFSAHGLRSAILPKPPPRHSVARSHQQSQHRSVQQDSNDDTDAEQMLV